MATVVISPGARATEERLLADLSGLLASHEEDAGLLAHPVVVVVPSQSLRDHLAAALVRKLGRPAAGVAIHTLHGLARAVLERAGRAAPEGDDLLDVLVRRHAREEPALARGLEPLRDGYGAVVATVADLLDAGLRDDDEERLDEALTPAPASDARERARATVRVAVRTLCSFGALGLGRASTRLERAAEIVSADPEVALRARSLLVHGFADATGAATALLVAACGHPGARVYVDEPPDPAEPGERDAGAAFAERLLERLTFASATQERDATPAPRAALQLIEAVGADAEARATAERVRALLDGGVEPERVGIVCRTLGPWVVPLRAELERLGVPFSSPCASAPPGAAQRRIEALVELLCRGDSAPVDRWLEARPGLPPEEAADLRLAFHAMGAARLGDVAALDPARDLGERESFALPVRRGATVDPDENGGDDPRVVLRRRGVARSVLEAAVHTARRHVARRRAWPALAPLATHAAEVRGLLSDLGGAFPSVATALAEIERSIPETVALQPDDVWLLLERALERCREAAAPFGGKGAGVQVLDATAARARTFEHLFVLGLERDVFPRIVLEDPFLPDDLRARMRPVLPDLAPKELGYVEERYLFAQLVSASPNVTLSRQIADDDGRPRAASPFVLRLRWNADVGEPARAPRCATGGPRTAAEHARAAALGAGWKGLAPLLPLALREAGATSTEAHEALAAARIAVLRELEGGPAPAPRGLAETPDLGPYLGFTGALGAPHDPRRRDLYVTTLENVAACPWQAFLRKVLGLEPPPDAHGALPAADARVVGSTVHAALEAIARESGVPAGRSLGELAAEEGCGLVWPPAETVERILAEAADRVRRDEGIALPGFARALAALARPALDAVRKIDEDEQAGTTLLGVESPGACDVADAEGRMHAVHFRADRVERVEGALRLTDFKTGRPISTLKSEALRERDLRLAIAKGERLQGAVYALAAAAVQAGGRGFGRYLFVGDGEDARAFAVDADAKDLVAAFQSAARATLAAWRGGSFFPRLVGAKGETPDRCAWCEVRDACLQGDSTARRRLERWSAGPPAAPSAAEAALLVLLRLGEEGAA